MKNYLFSEDIIPPALDLMMLTSLKSLNSNGCNHLIKNQETSQKMLSPKLELQPQEQIIHVAITKEKFTFSEVMEELDIKELLLTIFITMM